MTGIDRIPLAHSVRYVAHGLPEVPNHYGPGVLAPSEITLTYRAAPDSQLGRVHAYVAGRLWVDGKEVPLQPGGLYGQHYLDGLDNWPDWLAEEARLHDPAPAAVSAAVAPPADATHGLSVQHADALWDAVAIPGPHTPTYPEQHERVCRAVRDILDELTPAPAEPAARTALRDRIADKLTADAYECDGKCGLSERECYDAHPITFSAMAGGTTHVDGSVTAIADSLLAVLPEPADRAAEPVCICGHPNEQHFEDVCQTCGCGDYLEPQDAAEVIARWRQAALKARADRAAVLTEPERKMLAFALEITQEEIHARSLDLADNDKAALVSLRRMADETATETPTPHRGDAFEQWLKARRDEWAPEGCQPWQILDQTLEEYRLHADTRTPLGEHVCEGKTVGDCECLEQPAAGARQDGAES